MRIYTLLLAAGAFLTASAVVPPPSNIQPDYDGCEGTPVLYNRNCQAFEVEAYEALRHQSYGSIIEITENGNDLYFRFIVSEFPCEAYIKGERVGETVVIKGPQALYEDYNEYTGNPYMVYLVPLVQRVEGSTGYYEADDKMEFVFNVGPDGSLVSANPTDLLGVCTYSDATGYYWQGYGDRDITISKVTPAYVVPPKNGKNENWVWEDPYETAQVTVNIDGEDVYVCGMDRSLKKAWIKGKIKSDNEIEFPSGQYLGPDLGQLFFHYFCGYESTYTEDPETGDYIEHVTLQPTVTFKYDPQLHRMKSAHGYLINSTADISYPLTIYKDVLVEKQIRNTNCPPAEPYDLEYLLDDLGQRLHFQVPNTDTEGKMLDANNLYYEIFINGEAQELDIYYDDIDEHPTWIPDTFQDNYDVFVDGKDHTVYFYIEGVKTYGVRSLYVNEDGKVLYSEVCGKGPSAVEDIESVPESVIWHDLTGRRINRPAAGIAIRTVKYSDGKVSTKKVVVK